VPKLLERGAKSIAQQYVMTLKKLRTMNLKCSANRKVNQVFLLHDNTGQHTGPSTRETTATKGWTVLPHPLYSPDLAPPKFRLFGPLKDALPGQHFADEDELKYGVCEVLRCFSEQFYAIRIQLLTQRWKKCVDNERDLVEK
jgi:hypothetical protein